MTKMVKIFLLPLISVSLFAECPGDSWQLSSVFKDYGLPRDDGHGIHGVVVAPDGNIWVASTYNCKIYIQRCVFQARP